MVELWARITAQQPVPGPQATLVLGLIALALVVLVWPVVRMLATVVHEAGHAVVAMLVGRKLQGIRLHRDTSGLTVTRGRRTGPGMVATLLAGYPAPALFGLAAAVVLAQGYAVALLWGCLLALALMLLQIRNLVGFGVIVVALAGVGLATWYLPPEQQSWLAYLLTWVLLLSGPRAAVELGLHPGPSSDPGQLAQLTRIPTVLWTALFATISVLSTLAGVAVLLPHLLRYWGALF